MSAASPAGCGRPLRALALLLGAWVGARAMLWPDADALEQLPPALAVPLAPAARAPAAADALPYPQRIDLSAPARAAARPHAQPHPDTAPRAVPEAPLRPRIEWQMSEMGEMDDAVSVASMRMVVGHNMLMIASLSSLALDPALVPYVAGAGLRQNERALVPSPFPVPAPAPVFAPAAAERFAAETAAPHRWSADAWAVWREDDNSPLLTGRPAYGRSQAGAVLRFALAPASRHAPQAYVRASAALAGAREEEAALGISARPLPFVPVRLAAEGRLRESAAGTGTRAAVFAVSEFPPLRLPLGASGEAYVAGGYVTGRSATGFVDGQARITRELARADRFRISAGGGAWGGAQEGSGRLDIGPSAALSFSAGRVNARLSADYRFRVAGAAVPASGPALTISAGF